jgi:hypothetical protein
VIDEEDHVQSILDWLENVLPGVVLRLSGGNTDTNQVKSQPEVKAPVQNVKADTLTEKPIPPKMKPKSAPYQPRKTENPEVCINPQSANI